MSHVNHDRRSIKLGWAKSTGRVETPRYLLSNHLAGVDLWFCDDCSQYTYFDWHEQQWHDVDESTVMKASGSATKLTPSELARGLR